MRVAAGRTTEVELSPNGREAQIFTDVDRTRRQAGIMEPDGRRIGYLRIPSC